MTLEFVGPGHDVELMVEIGVGIDKLRGERRPTAIQQIVDAPIVARRPLVKVQALGNRTMADHAGTRDAVFAGFRDDCRGAAGVVQMSMRVDHGVDAGRGVSAYQRQGLILVEVAAGIDQHQPFIGLAHREIAEPSAKRHRGRDLLDLSGSGKRMLFAGGKLAAPQTLSGLFDSGHGQMRCSTGR